MIKKFCADMACRVALQGEITSHVTRRLIHGRRHGLWGRAAAAFTTHASQRAAAGTLRVADMDGYRMWVDLANGTGAEQYFLGRSTVFPFLAELVNPGDICVDVGANYGDFTGFFASRVGPTGRVVGYEPNPKIAAVLERTLSLNNFGTRVDLRRLAVSDVAGDQISFYLSNDKGNQGLSSLVPPTQRSWKGAEQQFEEKPILVRTTTLDADLASLGIDRVAVLKVDVEEADTAAIRGAAALIGTGRVGVVVVEMNETNRPDLVLTQLGMTCARVTSDGAAIKWYDARQSESYGDVVGFNTATEVGRRLAGIAR